MSIPPEQLFRCFEGPTGDGEEYCLPKGTSRIVTRWSVVNRVSVFLLRRGKRQKLAFARSSRKPKEHLSIRFLIYHVFPPCRHFGVCRTFPRRRWDRQRNT